jgi:DNA-binding CsgD family transcriptional regulator
MIPLAGFLADSALLFLIFSGTSKSQYKWQLFIFYASLALWNLSVMQLFLAKSQSEAKLILFVAHHIIVLIPWAFLRIAFALSGRSKNLASRISDLLTIIVLIILEYSFWFTADDTAFISGLHKYNWGYYPLLGSGAAVYSFSNVYCIVVGFYLLSHPQQDAAFAKRMRLIFIVFWLGALTSHLPVFGVEIFPLGNATDAVVSVFFAKALFEAGHLPSSVQKYLLVAGGIAATAAALIFSWIIHEFFVTVNKVLNVFLTSGSALVAIVFFQRFFRPTGPQQEAERKSNESLFAHLQVAYQLTYREATLCCLIADGVSRSAIAKKMNLSPNTLKVHLSSIYRKTIGRDHASVTQAKDKLQRLTVFLHDVDKKASLLIPKY